MTCFCPFTLVASTSTWHRCLDHPSVDVLSILSHDCSVICSRRTNDLYHACQLSHYTRISFISSNSHADNNFDLIHCDPWNSPIVSISCYKYYLVILITPILCGFSPYMLNLTLSPLCQFFAYVSTQFCCIIKAVQYANGREFDNASSHALFATNRVILRMSCPYTSP
jgi:hypothetical protein